MHSGAHTWLFPIVIGVGIVTSAYSATTGRRIGWGWPNNPAYNRFGGGMGVLIGLGMLIFWFVAVGP